MDERNQINKEGRMSRKGLIFFLFLLFIPLFLFAERPYLGIEWGIFVPTGDWGKEMGATPSFKISIHQKVIKNFSASISAGYVTFSNEHPTDFELLMSPLIYLDAIAETSLKKDPSFNLGFFLGSVYSAQKIKYEEGREKATIWGWSTGGLISFQFKFIKKAYFKMRFISQTATGGIEYSLGVNF